MKKNMSKLITLFLFLWFGIMSVSAQTLQIGYPNATDVIATLYNGTLTISGTGAMANYDNNVGPWSHRDDVTYVVIEDGVTTIGNYAFYCCLRSANVTIPNSVTSIGDLGVIIHN